MTAEAEQAEVEAIVIDQRRRGEVSLARQSSQAVSGRRREGLQRQVGRRFQIRLRLVERPVVDGALQLLQDFVAGRRLELKGAFARRTASVRKWKQFLIALFILLF